MKRRDFVSGLALAAGVTACGQEQADCGPDAGVRQETFEWNIATSWPPGLPGLGVGVENLAARIEKATNGRLKIKVFAGGELVPALEVLDAVSRGTVQMGHDSAYYHLVESCRHRSTVCKSDLYSAYVTLVRNVRRDDLENDRITQLLGLSYRFFRGCRQYGPCNDNPCLVQQFLCLDLTEYASSFRSCLLRY